MQYEDGIIESAQKVVIYGPEGIGKSTFASKFPRPKFEDTEGSTKHMDVSRTPKSSSWTMLFEHIKYFKAHPFDLDTYVLDTADWAELLAKDDICATGKKDSIKDFGYQGGYIKLAEEFGKLLNHLSDLIDLGITVVILCHAQMRKFEQPDEFGAYDRWEMKLEKRVCPLVREWADMVLFANYETLVIQTDDKKSKAQGGKRVMYTTHHPCWDAKNRHDLLEKLPFDFDEIRHCIPVRGTVTPPVNQPDLPKADPPTPPTGMKADWTDLEKKPEPHLPQALTDLMKENDVTILEIQKAVASNGYYPEDTPVAKYDPDFISGVLIGAWTQVFGKIKEARTEVY
jgi:GTPase SAR1 family protein